MTKILLEKAIERDSTFVTQQFFACNLTQDLATDYGIDCPYRPVVVHFANQENIQIFENKQALRWIQDKLLEKNLGISSFMSGILERHRTLLLQVEEYWKKAALEQEGFDEYKRLVRELTLNLTMYYYSGADERTPQTIKDMIVEIRKTDEFGARNDEFVRTCIAARGLDPELARVLLIPELLAPDKNVLEKRMEGAWLVDGVFEDSGSDVFVARHPEYTFETLPGSKDASSVKGQIAQKGTARGKVRIVKNRQQASEVVEGEIIVCPMTQPDFIQAMKKAAAFVTDEGGIVSHAAVIAREMKKPCIIGTKFATQIFKDGDRVEVDANNGIVRLI